MSDTGQGMLRIYGEPSSENSETEYNDWYDEHAPARLAAPGVLSAARYKATDSNSPSWIAMYDLASPDVIQSNPYQALAPANEQSIISQLSIIHPAVYSLFASLHNHNVTSASLPAKYMLAVDIDPPNAEIEEDQNKWYAEEHLDFLSKVPGFLRARRFKLVTHIELAGKTKVTKPSKYVTLYDWDRDTFMETQEFKDSVATPWSVKIIAALEPVLRVYTLQKSFSK